MKTATNKRKRASGNNLFISVTVVILVLVVFSTKYINKKAPDTRPATVNSTVPVTPLVPSPVPTVDMKETLSWKTYRNDKFGFSLKYPESLSLVGKEVSVFGNSALYRQYLDGCCGDMRSPEWIVSLENPKDGKVAVKVFIFEKPMSQYFFGEDHAGFTFSILNDKDITIKKLTYVDLPSEQVARIRKSLTFVKPEKPLGCLWDLDRGAGYSPDSEYLKTLDRSKLILLKGFYYDAKLNVCGESSYYTYRDQQDFDSLPFRSRNECEEACLQ